MIKNVVLVAAFCIPAYAYSYSTVDVKGTVEGLMTCENDSNTSRIVVNIEEAGTSTKLMIYPSSASDWERNTRLSAYSTLLSAQAIGRKVTVKYTSVNLTLCGVAVTGLVRAVQLGNF